MWKNNGICKVSIIVPAYNAGRYIERCIDSLVRQTYNNLQIILVDDGSTDLTGNICDSYQQLYSSLICVEHSKHLGVSNARLMGVEKAVGEYIAFVDADDWIECDYITSMMQNMAGADIVSAGISRAWIFEENNSVCEYNSISAGRYASHSDKKELYRTMLFYETPYQFGVLPYICNKVFKRALILPLLKKVDKRIVDGEDVAIVYQALLRAKVVVLTDDCKYHYINHRGSASFRDPEGAYLNLSYLYQELYACFMESEYPEILIEQLDNYMRLMVWKKDPAAYLMISPCFPCDKVKPGTRVILYGMGRVGRAFYQQVRHTRYCTIIAWTDGNPECLPDLFAPTARILPDQIKDYQFDYIVIAIQDKLTANTISGKLFSLGVDEMKIIMPDL